MKRKLVDMLTSRVLKKGKKSENCSNPEAKKPTILAPNGAFQHPARRAGSQREQHSYSGRNGHNAVHSEQIVWNIMY